MSNHQEFLFFLKKYPEVTLGINGTDFILTAYKKIADNLGIDEPNGSDEMQDVINKMINIIIDKYGNR